MFSLLFSFSFALVTIFEPVFFYKEGFSLSFIATYYAIHYTLYVFALPLGGMFASRFGVERSISLSLPIFVLYFLTLAAIPSNHNLVYMAAFLLTAHKIFYWPAFHADLAQFGNKRNRGTELSWMALVRYGVGILGPLIGGYVATLFGFSTLFTVAAVLVLISAIPMLRTADKARNGKSYYSSPWKIVKSIRYRNMVVSMLGWGENLIDLVFWPIFLFIVVGNAESLGILASLTAAVMTVFGFFIGELSDRFPRRVIIRLHLPFMVIGYFLRPLAASPLAALFTDMETRLAYAGVNLPTIYRLYELAGKSKRPLDYMVALELVLAITKAIVAIALALIFAFMLPYHAFWVTFVLAGILALFYAAL